MNIKINYKKIIGISLIINIIVISLSMVFVLSQSTNTFTISSGVYPSAYTYTIWVEDSTYYAKNAFGRIDYSGTNASEIFINTLANGGAIFVTSGTYLFTGAGTSPAISAFYLPSSTSLIGEDMFTTILKQADGANINRFITTNPATTVRTDIEISNLKIDGNYDNQDYSGLDNGDYKCSGIVTYGDRWKMTNLWIVDCGMYGGITAHGGDSVIENVIVEGTNQFGDYVGHGYASGIFLSGVSTLYNYSNIMVNNVLIKNVDGTGFFLEDMVNTNTITNVIIENSGYDGMRVHSCNNTIMNVQIRNSSRMGMLIWKAKMWEASFNTISNIRIEYSNWTGLHIYGGKYNNLIGNQFILNARGAIGGYNSQIQLDMSTGATGYTNCTRNVIANNIFLNDASVGYVIREVNNGQDFNLVIGNILEGSPSGGEIYLLGANSNATVNMLDAGFSP